MKVKPKQGQSWREVPGGPGILHKVVGVLSSEEPGGITEVVTVSEGFGVSWLGPLSEFLNRFDFVKNAR